MFWWMRLVERNNRLRLLQFLPMVYLDKSLQLVFNKILNKWDKARFYDICVSKCAIIACSMKQPCCNFSFHHQNNGKPHESAGRKATGLTQGYMRSINWFLILFGNWCLWIGILLKFDTWDLEFAGSLGFYSGRVTKWWTYLAQKQQFAQTRNVTSVSFQKQNQ